jgi:hypothetical protein
VQGFIFNQQGFGEAGGAFVVEPILCQEKVTANHGHSVGAHPVETFGFAGFQPCFYRFSNSGAQDPGQVRTDLQS